MSPAARAERTVRVASVNVLGCSATRLQSTRLRLDFLVAIARAIRRRGWRNLDAVVFPAGFLRTTDWLGPLSPSERRRVIESSDVGDITRVAAAKLIGSSPGCVFVVGLDTHLHRPWGFRGDQAAALVDAQGCLGVTRKVFPVDGDTNEWGRAPYLLDPQDAYGGERFVALPNGSSAMVALCYDAFVFSEIARGPSSKLGAMRYRTDREDGWNVFARGEAQAWIAALGDQIARHRPNVVLNPIHGFARVGAEGFWQRHGLASVSSFLDGALSVGAAHFRAALPETGQSPLASQHVPQEHLAMGGLRQAHVKTPIDSFTIRLRSAPRNRALVRLFEN